MDIQKCMGIQIDTHFSQEKKKIKKKTHPACFSLTSPQLTNMHEMDSKHTQAWNPPTVGPTAAGILQQKKQLHDSCCYTERIA